jgi:phosphoribosylaminoimidazole-succinocarboxamide synthase
MVVRGNLTGSAWRTYKEGKRVLCGVTLPGGLVENEYFPAPIITPTLKPVKVMMKIYQGKKLLSSK